MPLQQRVSGIWIRRGEEWGFGKKGISSTERLHKRKEEKEQRKEERGKRKEEHLFNSVIYSRIIF